MAMTREDMLRELELLPAWKLREPVTKIHEVATSLPTPEAIQKTELYSNGNMVENEAVRMPDSELTVEVAYQEPEQEQVKPAKHEEPAEIIATEIEENEALNIEHASTQTVFGMGDANADWLIVGEATGTEGDITGEPFVGPAGKLLDNMLAAIQLKRSENVYLANILRCPPPEDREQHKVEVMKSDPFLKRQVEQIKPKLIVAMGAFAAQSLLQSDNTVDDMRGQLHQYHDVPVIVTYHPADLLRNAADKAKAWEDLCFAKRTMQSLAM